MQPRMEGKMEGKFLECKWNAKFLECKIMRSKILHSKNLRSTTVNIYKVGNGSATFTANEQHTQRDCFSWWMNLHSTAGVHSSTTGQC